MPSAGPREQKRAEKVWIKYDLSQPRPIQREQTSSPYSEDADPIPPHLPQSKPFMTQLRGRGESKTPVHSTPFADMIGKELETGLKKTDRCGLPREKTRARVEGWLQAVPEEAERRVNVDLS